MTGPAIVLLVVLGVLFAAWVFVVFRALFGVLIRHSRETGKPWVGPIQAFSVYGDYLRDPAFRREKLIILALTVLLFTTTFLFLALGTG